MKTLAVRDFISIISIFFYLDEYVVLMGMSLTILDIYCLGNPGRVLPCMSYIGMCGPEESETGYRFLVTSGSQIGSGFCTFVLE